MSWTLQFTELHSSRRRRRRGVQVSRGRALERLLSLPLITGSQRTNWTELNWTTIAKLTQFHYTLLVTRASVTKLIGCSSQTNHSSPTGVKFSSVGVLWTALKPPLLLKENFGDGLVQTNDYSCIHSFHCVCAATWRHCKMRNLNLQSNLGRHCAVGNESVPIQLVQCRFHGLVILNAEILTYFFQIKYPETILSNSTRKLYETASKMTYIVSSGG